MEFERHRTASEVEAIVFSDQEPIYKVQELVKLGLDEELATEIVERYQIGQQAPIYYEQLPRY